ncbi:MAG: VIT1/CCC1 transporter family protein [Phycisphaerales bacterium]|nr:VIT1/CCC1 transporter family protein [Phycisphaerales bacterium]
MSHLPHGLTAAARARLRREHTPEAIQSRLSAGMRHSYLRDFIYGAIDGAVTTFAVVAGVVGADLPLGVVIILGLGNLFADGFSMAISNYLGTRAEHQIRTRTRRTEEMHIRTIPEGEREEIRQLFAGKGFTGEQLDMVVDVITADPKRWVDTMLTEEHGLALEGVSPWRAGLMTFIAFVLIGFIPLLPYVFDLIASGAFGGAAFEWSAAMTAAAFFIVGAIKSPFVDESWWRSGLETLLVGGIAAAMAFGIGAALQGLA